MIRLNWSDSVRDRLRGTKIYYVDVNKLRFILFLNEIKLRKKM